MARITQPASDEIDLAGSPELLADSYSQQIARSMRAATEVVHQEWFATADWTGHGMRAVQSRLASLANGYRDRFARAEQGFLTQYANALTDRRYPMTGVEKAAWATENMRGISDRTLWHRPIATYFTAKAEGHDHAEAMKRGWYRAREIADEQFQLTRNHVAREVLKALHADGYVRKPGPGACALCLAAGTKRYRSSQLMAMHPHCRCTTLPTFPQHQTKPLISKETAMAAAAAMTAGAVVGALAVREHGELGPTLAWQSQDFTGPSDI